MAACGAGAPTVSAPESSAAASLAASPTSSVPSAEAVPRTLLAARYLAIARPANERLDHDFDRLEDASDGDLQATDADLRHAAATERRFDWQLLQLPLPPAEEAIARLLVTANESRARLFGARSDIDDADRATSLPPQRHRGERAG